MFIYYKHNYTIDIWINLPSPLIKNLRMKNLSVALNVVLLVAVMFLYVKVFSGNKSKTAVPEGKNLPVKSANIYYVNADTLFENYDLYKETKIGLIKSRTALKTF